MGDTPGSLPGNAGFWPVLAPVIGLLGSRFRRARWAEDRPGHGGQAWVASANEWTGGLATKTGEAPLPGWEATTGHYYRRRNAHRRGADFQPT